MLERVALISSSFHPYPGGVEEHTRNVARELRALGHEVVVWTVDRGEGLGIRRVDDFEVRYLPTPLPAASPQTILRFAWQLPRAWSSWLAALRAFRPDILHVQCFGPNGLYALALHRRTGIPLIVSSHGETFADEHNVFQHSWLLRKGLQEAVRASRAVTGCSDIVLEDLRARFGLTSGVVVPNGVDLEEPTRLGVTKAAQPAVHPPTVFAVGRAVNVKGFDLLIRAFSIATLPSDTRLVIAGDGPEIPRLKALAREAGVRDAVLFTGRLDRAGVASWMVNSDVVVVPSRMEAFGIVILEAWRSGAAVVATRRGGPARLVRDNIDGRVVDPFDEEELAGAISDLVLDPAERRRLAEAGLDRVREFGWEAVAAVYAQVYASMPPCGSGPLVGRLDDSGKNSER